MLLDIVLTVGLLLTTASQLRAFGPAVGPGELLLLLWIIPNLFREASRLGPALTPPLTRLLTFWILFALALGIGTIVGFALESTRDINGYKHDAVAYALTAIVSCLLVVEPQGKRLRRVAWLLVSLGTIAVLVQVVGAQAGLALPLIDPWFWDRFRGWSDDPNVFALLCAVLLFLAIYLAETTPAKGVKFFAILCCLPLLYAGILTHSDSFVVALVFGGTTMLALWPASWLARADRKTNWRFFTIGAVTLLLLGLEFATGWISKGIFAVAYDDTDQVWIRLALWREAIKVGLDSYLFGFGPGPHLQTPYVQLRGTTVREAHNVVLHVLTQGGIIAVATFVWIMTTCWLAAYRRRIVALTALLSALAAFSLFHFLIRHPLFWFAIALTLVAGAPALYRSADFRTRVFKPFAAGVRRRWASVAGGGADRILPTWVTFSWPATAAAAAGAAARVADRAEASGPALASGTAGCAANTASTSDRSSLRREAPVVPLPYRSRPPAAGYAPAAPYRGKGKRRRVRPAIAALGVVLAAATAAALWQVQQPEMLVGGGDGGRSPEQPTAEPLGTPNAPPERLQEPPPLGGKPAIAPAGGVSASDAAAPRKSPSGGSTLPATGNAPTIAVQPTGPSAIVRPAGPPEKAPVAASRLPDVTSLMARGDAQLRLSDAAGARLFYTRAIALGSVPAITAMAKTYDPLFLIAVGVRGVRPEPGQAISWYQRAIKAGDADAGPHLIALVQRLRETSQIDAAEAATLLDLVK